MTGIESKVKKKNIFYSYVYSTILNPDRTLQIHVRLEMRS